MKSCYFTLIFIVLCSCSAIAQKLVLEQATVNFKVKNAGFWVNGYFDDVKAEMEFQQSKCRIKKLNGKLKVVSIHTGISLRDEHLKNDDYFDIEQYPEISLELLYCEAQNGKSLDTVFKLIIKNVEREIHIPLTMERDLNRILISADFEINRQDFGIGGDSLTLANEVLVNIAASFK